MAFTIPDSGKDTIPCDELAYYTWLRHCKVISLSNHKSFDIHAINTKRIYLESLGFIRGIDELSEMDLSILKATEEIFFLNELRPSLEALIQKAKEAHLY